MNIHYFIGIKIPHFLATSIVEARKQTNLHETHKILPVAEDLHITLCYLGNVKEDQIEQIIQSLQNNDWSSFELSTNGIAHFGNSVTPRVVYTALEENESLLLLQQKVMKVVANFIEMNNLKEFHPHITIAKKWASNGSLYIEEFPLTKTNFQVSKFSIFQINPSSTPHYEELYSIQLEGGEEKWPN